MSSDVHFDRRRRRRADRALEDRGPLDRARDPVHDRDGDFLRPRGAPDRRLARLRRRSAAVVWVGDPDAADRRPRVSLSAAASRAGRSNRRPCRSEHCRRPGARHGGCARERVGAPVASVVRQRPARLVHRWITCHDVRLLRHRRRDLCVEEHGGAPTSRARGTRARGAAPRGRSSTRYACSCSRTSCSTV